MDSPRTNTRRDSASPDRLPGQAHQGGRVVLYEFGEVADNAVEVVDNGEEL